MPKSGQSVSLLWKQAREFCVGLDSAHLLYSGIDTRSS